MRRLESLLFGIFLPFESAKLVIRDRTLLFWSALPMLLAAAAAFWLVSWLQTEVSGAIIRSILAWGWNPESFGAGLLLFFSRLLLIVVGALIFSFCASIVAAPFNDFLAEKTEALATPALPPTGPTPWRARIRLIRIDVIKTLAAAAGASLALVFSWVPIINLTVFALTFLLITFNFISYPQTRRGEGLLGGLAFLRKHPWASMGFGGITAVLFAIPFVSIFALPLSVIGGTLLYARASSPLPRLR